MTLDTCKDCPLYLTARQAVYGEGPVPARVMVVGEAPGADEDRQGRPFVGPSGRGLNYWLRLAGLDRSEVYVTNLVKHRPPNNRSPLKLEIVACSKWLVEELLTVKPEIIITVGNESGRFFLPNLRLTKDHGIPVWMNTYIVVPWYHPAYALRLPNITRLGNADAELLQTRLTQIGVARPVKQYSLATNGSPMPESFHNVRSAGGPFGFDTETTSPKRGKAFATDEARLIGYSLCAVPYEAVYLPRNAVDRYTQTLLEDSRITKVLHNSVFEYKLLARMGIHLERFEDTRLMAYLLEVAATDLKSLAKQFLGEEPITYKQLVGKGDMSHKSPEQIAPYACADADHTLRLHKVLSEQLAAAGLGYVYRDIELPLVPVIAEMESQGLVLDAARTAAVHNELTTAYELAEQRVGSLVGGDINVRSHEQMSERLLQMGFPSNDHTPAKNLLMMDEEHLRAARPWNPQLVDAMLEEKHFGKLRAYAASWLTLVGPDGRLHSSFNQAGTWEEFGGGKSAPVTGRLSSSGPNLQNIPHHSDPKWAKRLRECLVAAPDHVLVSADIEQEEPRIVAVLATDYTLLNSFADGHDIYRPATVALYPHTNVPTLNDRDWRHAYEEERYVGKTFFLAWYYGAEITRLLSLDPMFRPTTARAAIRTLEMAHSAREQYLADTLTMAQAGEVRTMFGRRRLTTKVMSGRNKFVQEGLREAANFRVQGTAADILKLALHRMWYRFGKVEPRPRLVATVHDEVIVECLPFQVELVALIVQEGFRGLLPMSLPVSFNAGPSLGELRPVHSVHMEMYNETPL